MMVMVVLVVGNGKRNIEILRPVPVFLRISVPVSSSTMDSG
jgi:hypothetical protein